MTFALVPSLVKSKEVMVRRNPDDFVSISSKKAMRLLGDPSASNENPAVPALVPCGGKNESWNVAFVVTLYWLPTLASHDPKVTRLY